MYAVCFCVNTPSFNLDPVDIQVFIRLESTGHTRAGAKKNVAELDEPETKILKEMFSRFFGIRGHQLHDMVFKVWQPYNYMTVSARKRFRYELLLLTIYPVRCRF